MKKIITKTDIKWLPNGSTLTLFNSDQLPEDNSIPFTSVFGFVVLNNRILVVYNKKENRGYEVPGGHLELNESLIHAVKRELMEEAGVKVSIPELIALYKIERSDTSDKYPKESYQAFFYAKADGLFSFQENDDIKERCFLTKDQFLDLSWAKRNKELVDIFLTKF